MFVGRSAVPSTRRSRAGVLALTPAAASAACPEGAQCATVTVPLDHSGATPGTLSLAYAKVPATGARTGHDRVAQRRPGPGGDPADDARSPSCSSRCASSYDIVTVDQRGTGESGAVDCTFEGLDDVAPCAAKLGDKRAFWNTPETAKDLEDLRGRARRGQAHAVRRVLRREGGERVRPPLPGLDRGARAGLPHAGRRPRRLRPAARRWARRGCCSEVCYPGPCAATVQRPGRRADGGGRAAAARADPRAAGLRVGQGRRPRA